jgi:hypothetical protein
MNEDRLKRRTRTGCGVRLLFGLLLLPKALGWNSHRVIKLAAEVLQGDKGGQFHHFVFGVLLRESVEKLIGRLHVREGDRIGPLEGDPLCFRIVCTALIARQVEDLRIGYSGAAGTSRVNILSEGTAVVRSDPAVNERLQVVGQ